MELSDFKIGLERGDLTAYGEWNLADRTAALQFTSSMEEATAELPMLALIFTRKSVSYTHLDVYKRQSWN